jgi:hypothetical protein
MSVCTNTGLDRSSRLAAYAEYVVLYARLRAQRVHQCISASSSRLAAYSERDRKTQDRTTQDRGHFREI